jgi:small-conductance mechanosensitive channel
LQDLSASAHFLEMIKKIFYSVLLVFWTIAGIKLTRKIVKSILIRLFQFSGLREDAIPALASLLKIIIIVISLIMLLAIWGVDLGPMLTSASIMSAVVLFAAKDTISNFFAGFTIIIDQPYKIGDYVDLSTERGEVVEIGLRSTRIKTRDDILISIPNAIIANEKIINESAPEKKFRVRVPIGVSYNCDIDLVEKILLEIAVENENIYPEPEPRVRFRSFGDSSLNFELLGWAKEPELRGLTIHQINKEIVKRFRQNSIEIPYPQRDLHIITDRTKKA